MSLQQITEQLADIENRLKIIECDEHDLDVSIGDGFSVIRCKKCGLGKTDTMEKGIALKEELLKKELDRIEKLKGLSKQNEVER